jgi:hypothetical protein
MGKGTRVGGGVLLQVLILFERVLLIRNLLYNERAATELAHLGEDSVQRWEIWKPLVKEAEVGKWAFDRDDRFSFTGGTTREVLHG